MDTGIIFGQKLITSCLEKLLTVSGMESENAVITKLNNMGIRNGEEPGWDVHTLNKEMIGMLKQDCEGTAKKIKNNSFSRWKEEHKQELDWYCESFTEFAYLAVIYSLSISNVCSLTKTSLNLLKILSFLIRYSIIECRKNIRIRTKTLHSGENSCINSNDTVSLDLQISTSRRA